MMINELNKSQGDLMRDRFQLPFVLANFYPKLNS